MGMCMRRMSSWVQWLKEWWEKVSMQITIIHGDPQLQMRLHCCISKSPTVEIISIETAGVVSPVNAVFSVRKNKVLRITLIKIWCSYKLSQVVSQQASNDRHVSKLHFSEARGYCWIRQLTELECSTHCHSCPQGLLPSSTNQITKPRVQNKSRNVNQKPRYRLKYQKWRRKSNEIQCTRDKANRMSQALGGIPFINLTSRKVLMERLRRNRASLWATTDSERGEREKK